MRVYTMSYYFPLLLFQWRIKKPHTLEPHHIHPLGDLLLTLSLHHKHHLHSIGEGEPFKVLFISEEDTQHGRKLPLFIVGARNRYDLFFFLTHLFFALFSLFSLVASVSFFSFLFLPFLSFLFSSNSNIITYIIQ